MFVVFKNEATIDYHHGSALKLRNTCRRNLTQQLASWSNSVVLKVWVETRQRVAKDHKWVAPRWSKPGLCIF